MKKEMSYEKYRAIVIFLDVLYFCVFFFLALYSKTSKVFISAMENELFYSLIWGVPTFILFVLNWQMLDEGARLKKGIKINKRVERFFLLFFNMVFLVNMFFIIYLVRIIVSGELFPSIEYYIIISLAIFAVSFVYYLVKLILKK